MIHLWGLLLMTKEILHFQTARDFHALKEFFVRIFRETNKESILRATYRLPETTKIKCDCYDCNEYNFVLNPDVEHNKAQFKFVYQYPYKKGAPSYSLNFCLECIKKKVKKYFDELFYYTFENYGEDY